MSVQVLKANVLFKITAKERKLSPITKRYCDILDIATSEYPATLFTCAGVLSRNNSCYSYDKFLL